MSTTYVYSVNGISGVAARVTQLDTKLTIDPDLASLYTSTTHNLVNDTIEVVFSSSLNRFNIGVLNNLTRIILYDEVVQESVYVVDHDAHSRRSINAAAAPTAALDLNSGFSVGSRITRTNGEIYVCTDNSADNAMWAKIYPNSGPTGPEGSFSEVQSVSSTTTTSTTSTSNVELAEMSLTATRSGNHIILFDANMVRSSSSKLSSFVIKIDGTPIPVTQMDLRTSANYETPVPIRYHGYINSGSVVTVCYFQGTSGGTLTVRNRTLILIRE